jgi:hypothetical protein
MPPAAVLEFIHGEQQAEEAYQRDDQSGMRQFQRQRRGGGDGSEQQGHRQQQVGVADHPVGGQDGLRAAVRQGNGLDSRIIHCSLPVVEVEGSQKIRAGRATSAGAPLNLRTAMFMAPPPGVAHPSA